MFNIKVSNQNYDGEKLIADSGDTPYRVNLEENTKNLKGAETRIIVGSSITLTRTKRVIGMEFRTIKENSIMLHYLIWL